jgi:hypothetical protein
LELGISAVFETSAKSNQSIDDIFFRVLLNCLHLSDGGHSYLRPYGAHSQRYRPSFTKNTLASFLADGNDSTSDQH